MKHSPFFYRDGGFLKSIDLDEIRAIEAAGNYIRLYSLKEEDFITIRVSLEETINQLPENLFVQIHRSVVVSVQHIETIGKDFLIIRTSPPRCYPLSKRYYGELMVRIRIIEPAAGVYFDEKE